MTLTYNLETLFLFATHHLIMMIICANLSFKTPARMTKLLAEYKQNVLKPMHKFYVQTVTLTFDLAAWFLFTTRQLVMTIICAELFSNPTMHNKLMGRA